MKDDLLRLSLSDLTISKQNMLIFVIVIVIYSNHLIHVQCLLIFRNSLKRIYNTNLNGRQNDWVPISVICLLIPLNITIMAGRSPAEFAYLTPSAPVFGLYCTYDKQTLVTVYARKRIIWHDPRS